MYSEIIPVRDYLSFTKTAGLHCYNNLNANDISMMVDKHNKYVR